MPRVTTPGAYDTTRARCRREEKGSKSPFDPFSSLAYQSRSGPKILCVDEAFNSDDWHAAVQDERTWHATPNQSALYKSMKSTSGSHRGT
jgi:hypothetical protein